MRPLALILFAAGACAPSPPPPPQRSPPAPMPRLLVLHRPPAPPPALPPSSASPSAPLPHQTPPDIDITHDAPYRKPLARTGDASPANRYAKLSPAACRQQLTQRALPVSMVRGRIAGIATPVRITGPMRGVTFVTGRAPSPFGLLDCRLALALDDLAGVVTTLGITQVHIGSMYRPGAKIAGLRNKKSQHRYGLAADISSMRTKTGQLLRVDRDWHALIGQTACGPNADMRDPTAASVALRSALCRAAQARLFHHVLTPCFNAAHRDHIHVDIKRTATYHSVN